MTANLVVGGILASVIVIVIGVFYALPPYITAFESSREVPRVLLSLSINSDRNMPEWCQAAAELLNGNQVRAAVFFSGKVAEQYPDCVRSFNDGVDVGSSTYTFTKLSAERDYLDQLSDVERGKAAVDSAANLNSTLFKAPYGYTDDNIYSLLARNNIVADFSATDSFNKYNDEIFILHELRTFDLTNSSADEIESQVSGKVSEEIQVVADNSVPIENVASLVATILEKHEGTFVNASDLTGMKLNMREQ